MSSLSERDDRIGFGYVLKLFRELPGFLARDPYRKRLDTMTLNEATRLADEGKLTVKEMERVTRLANRVGETVDGVDV